MHIAIVGLGLIGGSLGLAFKAACGSEVMITGVARNEATLRQAVECGAVDSATSDLLAGIREADMVFLCTPVLQIVPLVEKIAAHLKPGAILTDAGSTKRYLMERIPAILPQGVHFVGGHPMAGREKSGIFAADKDLFKDKWYILTPSANTDAAAVDTVRKVVAWTGAKITVMEDMSHDRCAAVISHVPHVLAAAMVNLIDCYADPDSSLKLAAGGFRDTTRIASSDADMWADICMTNAEAITDGLNEIQTLLNQMTDAIKRQDRQAVHEFFSRAKARRDELLAREKA